MIAASRLTALVENLRSVAAVGGTLEQIRHVGEQAGRIGRDLVTVSRTDPDGGGDVTTPRCGTATAA